MGVVKTIRHHPSSVISSRGPLAKYTCASRLQYKTRKYIPNCENHYCFEMPPISNINEKIREHASSIIPGSISSLMLEILVKARYITPIARLSTTIVIMYQGRRMKPFTFHLVGRYSPPRGSYAKSKNPLPHNPLNSIIQR